jgi:hypothetical protein
LRDLLLLLHLLLHLLLLPSPPPPSTTITVHFLCFSTAGVPHLSQGAAQPDECCEECR